MGLGQQFTYTCPTSKLNFEQTSQAKIHQHLTSCSVCSGPIRFLRHERIVAAVHRVLRWQGFVSEANPRDMPCPHKSRGGPDFLIWAAVTAIGDVCVSKHTKASFKRKMNQYEELAGMLPNSIVVPLVFGINATPLKESVIELQKVCGKRVTREICLICQMEFARGVTNGMSRLRVRAKTQSQGGACEWSSDSDSVE